MEGALPVQQVDDLVGHCLLRVLGGEHEHTQVVRQRLAEHREEDGGGLSQPGRRLDQQVLALLDREAGAVDDLLLARPGLVERELEPFGGQLAALALRSLRFVLADEPVESQPDVGVELLEVQFHVEAFDLGAADLDQDEFGAHRQRGGDSRAVDDPGVDRCLPAVGREQRRRRVGVRPHGLDLLDRQPALGVAVEAVGPAGQGHPPAPVLELERQLDLAPVARLALHRLFLVAAVDRLADPEPLETAAVGEPEVPRGAVFEQVRHGQPERPPVVVETRRHRR